MEIPAANRCAHWNRGRGQFGVMRGIPVSLLLAFSPFASAERKADETFLQPPKSVMELFNRDKNYATLNLFSPDGDHFAVPQATELSDFKRMSQKTYRLAMLEVNPEVNRELDHSTVGIYGLKLYSLKEKRFYPIGLPPDTIVSELVWSPDGARLAFLAHLSQGSQVWVADARTGETRPWNDSYVIATLAARAQFGRGVSAAPRMLQWTPDGSILTLIVPADRGPEPQGSAIWPGPRVYRSREKATPTVTLPFLFKSDHEQALFRHYTTSQLAMLAPGKSPRKIGAPAMYMEFSLSPDGKHVLADTIVEPFSTIVGYTNFGHNLEVMDLDGRTLATVRKTPLREVSVRERDERDDDLPREVAWRPDGKGITFLSLDKKQSDPKQEADSEGTDRLMLLEPPFDMSATKSVFSSARRISNVSYSRDGRYAIATLTQRMRQNKRREDIVALDLSTSEPQQFALVRNSEPDDLLNLQGSVMTRATANGIAYTFLSRNGNSVYLEGPGYSSDHKPRPFIDRVSIRDGQKQRVFEGSAEMFERPLVPLDQDMERIVVSRESRTQFPNSFLRARDGVATRLTDNRDPFPEITACKRIDFSFKRRDGVTIQARISLPVGYKEGTRVPAIFWDYPREYSSSEDYAKDTLRARNHDAFTHLSYLRWSDIWLTQGYALVYTDIPIIGKGNEYNTNYINHLVDTTYAAIRKVDEMGYVDIDRIGHGGHSYGAFATANLLAHTPFFKAGIAGDGAYNRTLTPMTFQQERRFFWDTRTTYQEMSPFFYADRINTPLLLYHFAEDDNSGTFLIQSERMIQALIGLGKKAVLYVYPFDAHSPRCRENYLDLWSRWLEWFDTHVKGEKPATN